MAFFGVTTRNSERLALREDGFTLTEMLACVILVGLLSLCLATGIQFASKSYRDSVLQSGAQTLSSTLTNAIEDEIRFAIPVTADDGSRAYVSSTFGANSDPSAKRKAGGLSLGQTSDGQVTINGHALLAASAYPEGVKVRIDKFELANDGKTFSVQISVCKGGNSATAEALTTSKFQARALNG